MNKAKGAKALSQELQASDIPPHVYTVADRTYSQMMAHKRDQSVIVSGESGAGKTESCKRVMAYLAHLSGASQAQPQHLGAGGAGGNKMADIEQRVLECNPFLEAFGNAKTLRNNNSSRFGKFINIQYASDKQGCIAGVEMQHYLLEKSRLVSTPTGERNYHVLCQLC